MKIKEKTKQAGLQQASPHNLKPCPKDGGKAMLFAGDGMWDYDVICYSCEFRVSGTSMKQAIRRWNESTPRSVAE